MVLDQSAPYDVVWSGIVCMLSLANDLFNVLIYSILEQFRT